MLIKLRRRKGGETVYPITLHKEDDSDGCPWWPFGSSAMRRDGSGLLIGS